MTTALQSTGSRWRAVFTGIRDVTMTGLALYGVWHQEHTGKVNPWLLLTYVVILGLIPASHAIALLWRVSSAPSSPPAETTGTAPTQR